jgi:hypothetical protein
MPAMQSRCALLTSLLLQLRALGEFLVVDKRGTMKIYRVDFHTNLFNSITDISFCAVDGRDRANE